MEVLRPTLNVSPPPLVDWWRNNGQTGNNVVELNTFFIKFNIGVIDARADRFENFQIQPAYADV